ncbi:hypothetical protein [Microbacterium sp.]|uniref:hypothetical protein n=1 Tax=Microbacterium sp. TaxID=51671 RepID=UPI003A92DCFE
MAALITVLGWMVASPTAAGAMPNRTQPVFAYDASVCTAPAAASVSERGPPPTYGHTPHVATHLKGEPLLDQVMGLYSPDLPSRSEPLHRIRCDVIHTADACLNCLSRADDCGIVLYLDTMSAVENEIRAAGTNHAGIRIADDPGSAMSIDERRRVIRAAVSAVSDYVNHRLEIPRIAESLRESEFKSGFVRKDVRAQLTEPPDWI